MKKEIMEIWVAALRSGEYKQGQKRLLKDGKHCCLGVLCELTPEINKWTPTIDSSTQFDGETSTLPLRAVTWAGLNSWSPMLDAGSPSLVGMNDGGTCFSEIADYIEANYEQL